MTTTREEEVVLLYVLEHMGGKASSHRVKHFILENKLLMIQSEDLEIVSTGESRVENRIAWTRQNLKDQDQLAMPARGVWQITETGRSRLYRVAQKSVEPEWGENGTFGWERFSRVFLDRLNVLGQRINDRSLHTVAQ